MYSSNEIVRDFFILILILSSFLAKGQEVSVLGVLVEDGQTTIEVPVAITFSDSILGLQFSVVWPESELALDTVLFNQELLDQNISIRYSNPQRGKLIVLIAPEFGFLDPIVFEKESIGLTIVFRLLDQYSGSTIIGFDPEFPNVFADFNGHVYPTLTNGSISNADGTVSTLATVINNTLKIYPNPTKGMCSISGLPASSANTGFRIVDVLGGIILTGKLNNNGFSLPQSTPSGTYWILIDGDEKVYVEPLVVNK
ncbi:T9SS type A sorting domain-containing protein [Neolewinella agarilytica]|uniref:Por secretion system C-terminal sorting domain-containing protein n=1 Tax=Neolewinella agarilytica TaxID=478744 RepID=A0A1H9CKM7_9BACT|nr:T9SS type A sorting domain-containing protein [Neolewinella agarilytica]SEQ01168.1 Por secretion system C-terminal sorting domain-containing protein [Neolewinella agarilytica]